MEGILALLEPQQIEERLAGLDGWSQEGAELAKTFDRGDFTGSVAFAQSIVGPSNEMNHHPDLAISWSEVKVSISTHSEGGLTAADFELAGRIDALAG